MLNNTEPSTAVWASLKETALQVLKLVDIRLALLICLATFMLAVGLDSSGNAAQAADLVGQSSPVPVTLSAGAEALLSIPQNYPASVDSEVQQATARRLRHSSLTGASLINNRLTDAYLFTDLPSER